MSIFGKKIGLSSDLAFAMGIIMILLVMIIPVPPFFLDLLLSLSIALSIVILLLSVYTKKALELSVFPSILLVSTLFRLSLNIASTRLVLLNGSDLGTGAAGQLIQSFGAFVVGGNYAVGAVIFLILVIINFIVITKGAGRVAEVSARFTLDAMPGKQMAIDADLNAGIINEEESRRRRSEIAREADFYGSMDGASKFVRGDAIAGLLIVGINIIGGLLIATLQKGKSLEEAFQVYTLLTIGDGLISQIPALIVSTAAGIIVTRSASGENLGQEVQDQLFRQPKVLYTVSAVMFVLAIVPGLPFVPFMITAFMLGYLAYILEQKQKEEEVQQRKKSLEANVKPEKEKLESILQLDPLELEVGYGLISIVDSDQNGELLERVTNIRKQFALDLGIIVPSLRIRDNLQLKPGEYRIYLKGALIGHGDLMLDHLMAMDPGNISEKLAGIPTVEPAFHLSALWIDPRLKEKAQYSGYTVVDLPTIIATHFTELLRKHSHELLGRQELQTLLDIVRTHSPKLVEEVIDKTIVPMPTLLRVLQNLLKETVSIRDLRSILEALSENIGKTKDPFYLTEHVRVALGRTITKRLVNDRGELPVITLDKSIEEAIAQGILQTDQGPQLSLDPGFIQPLIQELNAQVDRMMIDYPNATLLVSPAIRGHFRNLIDRFIPQLNIVSHQEVSTNIMLKSFSTVRMSYAN